MATKRVPLASRGAICVRDLEAALKYPGINLTCDQMFNCILLFQAISWGVQWY
jgi:hypothetical protein